MSGEESMGVRRPSEGEGGRAKDRGVKEVSRRVVQKASRVAAQEVLEKQKKEIRE